MYKESFVMKVLEMRFCWKELEQTHLFTPPKYGMHSKQILPKLKQPSLFFRSAEINFWLLPGHNVYIITIRGYLKLKWFLPLKSVIFEHYFCSYKMFVWSLNSDKQTFTPLSPFCHLPLFGDEGNYFPRSPASYYCGTWEIITAYIGSMQQPLFSYTFQGHP